MLFLALQVVPRLWGLQGIRIWFGASGFQVSGGFFLA